MAVVEVVGTCFEPIQLAKTFSQWDETRLGVIHAEIVTFKGIDNDALCCLPKVMLF